MARSTAVNDSDLLRILDEEIASGVTFDNDDPVTKVDGVGYGDRSTALDYYDGIMRDLPAEKGRSKIVSRDVADVIDTMMPGLMRIFAGSGALGKYEPTRPGDEPSAAQATDYVNHVLKNECDGYLVLYTQIMDALQVRNGVVKCWWDTSTEDEVENLTGLSEDDLVPLMDDPGVDLLAAGQRVELIKDPATGATVPLTVWDLRIRRRSEGGRLRVENVPPEDFGISAKARSIETARCVWQRARMTRSELIKQGYGRKDIDALPAWGRPPSENRAERDRIADDARGSGRDDDAMAEVEIIEAYLFADCDGDSTLR